MKKAVTLCLSLAAASMAVGCSVKDKITCEKLYERMSSCFSTKERERPDRSKFLAGCKRESKARAYRKEYLSCARRRDCSGFKRCIYMGEAASLREKMQRSLRSGNWEVADWTVAGCTEAIYKDHLRKICSKALPAAYKYHFAKVKAVRDRPMSSRTGTRAWECHDLLGLAKALGGVALADARKLCDQEGLSWSVFHAIGAARKRLVHLEKMARAQKASPGKLSSGKPPHGAGVLSGLVSKGISKGAPTACFKVDDQLAAETGAWAKPHRAELHKRCFIDIGKVLLSQVVASRSCPDSARMVKRRIVKHNLSAPGLKALLEAASVWCDSKVRIGKTSVSGGLDAAAVRRTIDGQLQGVNHCYISLGLASNPSMAGTVRVNFTIEKSGAVGRATIASSALDHEATERCILAATRRWRFPKPKDPMPLVNALLHFKPKHR